MIKVVNKKSFGGSSNSYYIGRPSLLGNPFRVGRDGSREQTIEKYRRWLWGEIKKHGKVYDELLRLLVRSDNLVLVCWCKPLACHGDVIVKAIRWLQNQRAN